MKTILNSVLAGSLLLTNAGELFYVNNNVHNQDSSYKGLEILYREITRPMKITKTIDEQAIDDMEK